jgi:hypothetical protein
MPWPDAKLKADKSLLKRTAFPWTILRPGLLTEDAAAGQIEMGHIPLSPGIPVRVAFDACHADDGGSAQMSPPLFWLSSSAKTPRASLWISPGAPRPLTRRSTLRSRRAKRSSMPSYYHSTSVQCREPVQPDLQRCFSWTRIGPNATTAVLSCVSQLRSIASDIRADLRASASSLKPPPRCAPTDVRQKK